MNTTDALELVQLVKALCPGTPMEPGTPRAWAMVLRDVSVKDAGEAVRRVYLNGGSDRELGARRLEPDDVLREVRRMRQERVAAAPPFVPVDPDASPVAQINAQRAYYRAAADGKPLPALPAEGRRSLSMGDPSRRTGAGPTPVGRLPRNP